jgi:hypothetical protein
MLRPVSGLRNTPCERMWGRSSKKTLTCRNRHRGVLCRIACWGGAGVYIVVTSLFSRFRHIFRAITMVKSSPDSDWLFRLGWKKSKHGSQENSYFPCVGNYRSLLLLVVADRFLLEVEGHHGWVLYRRYLPLS